MIYLDITLEACRQTLLQIGIVRGLSPHAADLIVGDYLDAELAGIPTHGVLKFLALPQAIAGRQHTPAIRQETQTWALIDGGRELGPLAARFALHTALDKAHASGIGVAAMRNFSRYGRLAPYGQIMAEAGFIGLIANQGGLAVAPPGAFTPVSGANPICFAFPRADASPLVIDFSTSQGVWSEVLLATAEGRTLPPEVFLDSEGRYTVEPDAARAVHAFGGAKGFALNLAIELLCGAWIGGSLGPLGHGEYDLGALFVALDPALWREENMSFGATLGALVEAMRAAIPLPGAPAPRLPGERAAALRDERLNAGMVRIHADLWARLEALAQPPG